MWRDFFGAGAIVRRIGEGGLALANGGAERRVKKRHGVAARSHRPAKRFRVPRSALPPAVGCCRENHRSAQEWQALLSTCGGLHGKNANAQYLPLRDLYAQKPRTGRRAGLQHARCAARSGFFIHGGSDFNTRGCIDLQEGETKFQQYFVSTGLSSIYVYVKYDKERVVIQEKKPKVYIDFPPYMP